VKKATYVVSRYYLGNRAFDLEDKKLNRDDCLYLNWLLRDELLKAGYELATQDINPIDDSGLVIYSDLPDRLPRPEDKEKSVLLLWESEIIKPENFDLRNHANFRTIFTWRSDLVDGKRYLPLHYAQRLDFDFDPEAVPEKDVVLISANKKSLDKRELYSKRLEVVRWFEKNAPDHFDLYGMGWDKYASPYRAVSIALSRMPGLAKKMAAERPSWKGAVSSKRDVLSRYKFTIAFENSKDIPGYVTEKIIDPMLAGSIPVYWGAPNITDIIPDTCFIDARKIDSIECLCSILIKYNNMAIQNMRKNISDFLADVSGSTFNVRAESRTLAYRILEHHKNER